MKIKTKFIFALILLVLLPATFTVSVTSNFLSENLNFIHFFDTYFDIFNNFSKISTEFEHYVAPYSESPEFFLSDTFKRDAKERFSSSFLIVEVAENGNVLFTTYSEDLSDATFIENWFYKRLAPDTPTEHYSLKHHHLERLNGNAIDVRLKIDSTRLELAYQAFERVFFLLYGAFNLILLAFLIAWISNPIKDSIQKLTFTTNEIRKGNLNAELSYNENDDFEELALSIESMRQSLKRSVEKQKMLESEKKELIANISHDLRTPITSIRGYVQGLKDGVARTETTQKEYLDIIESKTYMIESLVNDLSEFTGYDTNSIKLNKQVIDLRSFLFDCVDELESDVTKFGGQLYLHYIIKDTMIDVDPEKLMRVFINLIENAVKYRSDKPIEIVILANRDDDGVFINISDNGIGVPEADLDRIFDRFYRSDKSRNLDVGGNGIGLSICKEIIEAHGGKISATGNDINGLTISIRLKAYEEIENVPLEHKKNKSWREKYGKNSDHRR